MARILIIKIGAIGDVVLSLPMLAHLQGRLTWVVGEGAAPLLKVISRVDSVIVIDEHKLLHGSTFSKVWQVLRVWKKLFFRRFDLVITAHPDARYRLLSLACFKKEHRFFQGGSPGFPTRGIFHGVEYLTLATGREDNILHWPKVRLPTTSYGHGKPLIVFSPGGDALDEGKRLRIWPIHYYVRCVELLCRYECECVLVGLATEKNLAEYFKGFSVIDLIGRTTLLELMALLKQCFCLVTHDGGALHLARLVGCRVCGIFGPTSPKDFAWPSENEIVLWGGDQLECRPCYKGKSFAKCTHQSCMNEVQPEDVVRSIIEKWGLKLK